MDRIIADRQVKKDGCRPGRPGDVDGDHPVSVGVDDVYGADVRVGPESRPYLSVAKDKDTS